MEQFIIERILTDNGLSIAILSMLVFAMYKYNERREAEYKATTQANFEAILKLLGDMNKNIEALIQTETHASQFRELSIQMMKQKLLNGDNKKIHDILERIESKWGGD